MVTGGSGAGSQAASLASYWKGVGAVKPAVRCVGDSPSAWRIQLAGWTLHQGGSQGPGHRGWVSWRGTAMTDRREKEVLFGATVKLSAPHSAAVARGRCRCPNPAALPSRCPGTRYLPGPAPLPGPARGVFPENQGHALHRARSGTDDARGGTRVMTAPRRRPGSSRRSRGRRRVATTTISRPNPRAGAPGHQHWIADAAAHRRGERPSPRPRSRRDNATPGRRSATGTPRGKGAGRRRPGAFAISRAAGPRSRHRTGAGTTPPQDPDPAGLKACPGGSGKGPGPRRPPLGRASPAGLPPAAAGEAIRRDTGPRPGRAEAARTPPRASGRAPASRG